MMRPERTNEANIQSPETADDFKLIRGIGSAIERRLHEAGIHTFLQLAAQTPEGISGLLSDFAGLTPKRISAMDWIGQARSLATEREYAEPVLAVPSKEGHKHYSTFTVELLLDDQNNIRRTRVVHVQTGRESSWASWKLAQLEKTMLDGVGAPPAAESTTASTQVQARKASSEAVQAPITGQLHILELRVLREGSDRPTRMLPYGQPYVMLAVLDLSSIPMSGQPSIQYEATVYARDMSSSGRAIIGETSGTLSSLAGPPLPMRGKDIGRGIYRLEIVVVLSVLYGQATPAQFQAIMEGSLLQIY